MTGRYVMTENELVKLRPTPESIGMGSYTIDSHNVQRYVTPEGYVQNEGDIGVSTVGPYQISLGSIQPKPHQATNLIVPVAVSSSHIAFGSIRMEPVFMILGQSAGALAVLAIDRKSSVQDVPYELLKNRLIEAGQVLEYESVASGTLTLDKLSGVVVDDEMSEKVGDWTSSTSMGKWIHRGYVHDGNPEEKGATIRFESQLPASGFYEVGFAFPHHANRASKLKITVLHAEGESVVVVNQKLESKEPFTKLGVYQFDKSKPAAVVISNEGADGYVVADAVQFLAVQP
jgi:hypothetical protein